MQELLQNPAVIGGLAAALVVALAEMVKGLFGIYQLRRQRTFESRMAPGIDCRIQRLPREDILHCAIRVTNIGDVKTIVRTAIVELRAPLLQQKLRRDSRAYKFGWAEPEEFEAFAADVLPGLALNPREGYEAPCTIGLSPESPQLLEVTLRVCSEEGIYWSTTVTVTKVANDPVEGNNESGHQRRPR